MVSRWFSIHDESDKKQITIAAHIASKSKSIFILLASTKKPIACSGVNDWKTSAVKKFAHYANIIARPGCPGIFRRYLIPIYSCRFHVAVNCPEPGREYISILHLMKPPHRCTIQVRLKYRHFFPILLILQTFSFCFLMLLPRITIFFT